MTCDIGNPGPCLGQAQKCGGLNRFNGFPSPPLLINESPTAIHKKKQSIKNLYRFASTQKDQILPQKHELTT